MALPVSIGGPLETGGFAGPFKASTGRFFFLARGSSAAAQLRPYQQTDVEGLWGSATSITIPNISTATTAGLHSVDAVQDGDILHIATVDADVTVSTQTRIHYHKYDMATLTWLISNELVDGPTDTQSTSAVLNYRSVSIIRRSASVVIAYQSATVVVMTSTYSRCSYRERTDAAGTWGAAVAVDTIGSVATNATHLYAVKDPASNRIHFFWSEGGTGRLRTLSAANSFSTLGSVFITTNASATPINPYSGAAYVSGGVTKVVSARTPRWTGVFRFDSADVPSFTSLTTTVSGAMAGIWRVFADDERFYVLHAETTSADVYVSTSKDHGATWSTPTVSMAATLATATAWCSTNGGRVYERGGNYVLPYVVNDAGTVKYNEVILRPATISTVYWDRYYEWGDAFAVTNSSLTAQRTGTSGFYAGILAGMPRSTGKYVIKFTVDTAGAQLRFGLATRTWSGQRLGGNGEGLGFMLDGDIEYSGQDASPFYTMPAALTAGAVRYLAVDFTLGHVWIHNGTSWFPGDPASVGGMQLDGSPMPDMRGKTWHPAFGTESSEVTSKVTVDGTATGITLPTGFLNWEGGGGAPAEIAVTGAQTLSAVTQSSDVTVPRNATAAQTTAEAATAGTIQAQEARAVTGAQTLDAATQTSAVALLAKVTTGSQGTSATTQTSAVAAGLAVTGSQTLSAVTHSSGVKVGLAVTGSQNTNAATTVADADAIATGTAAQTLAATTQTSGLTLGPASFAVTGAQTLSAATQVFTANIGAAFVTVTGAQTTLEATTSAAAKALASVTAAQNTNAVTQSLTADVDLAVTASQTLSPVATSAVAKALAAVTGLQTLAAPTTSATAGAAATVTTGSQTTSEAATSGTIALSVPGQVTVTGAQTLSEAATGGAIGLGPLPALNVTGAQTLAAVTTTGTIDGGGVPVEPPVELPGGGGGSRAYRRRLREAREGRRRFEEEREKRIAALGVVIERPPLIPAPETVAMINRVLYEPIVRPIEVEPTTVGASPAPQQEFEDDGGEEELLLLLSAA